MAETIRGMASGLGTFLGAAGRGKAGEPGPELTNPSGQDPGFHTASGLTC